MSSSPSPLQRRKSYSGFDLTAQEIEEFRQAFSVFDRDGNGCITHKELGTVMRSLGQNPTETELMIMINENDSDGNGIIDFDEFIGMMEKRLKLADPFEDYEHAYMVFDKEKKGYIATEDLKHVLQNVNDHTVSEEEIDELIRDMDRDSDNRISYREYIDLVARR